MRSRKLLSNLKSFLLRDFNYINHSFLLIWSEFSYPSPILRKIIEDETEAEAIAKEAKLSLPKLTTVHSTLVAIRYPYTGEEGWAIRSKLCASDYGKGQDVCVCAKDVCNWLLHSYVWGVAHNSERKSYAGFLVASDFDKEKYVHYISFEEWQKFIVNVIQNSTF